MCVCVCVCVCVCSLEHSFCQLFRFRVKGGTCRWFWSFLLKPCKAVTRLLSQSYFKHGPLTNAGPRAVCDGLQPSKYRNSEHSLRHWHQFERVILRLLNLIIKIKGLYFYVFLFHFHFLIFITYLIFLFHFLVTHIYCIWEDVSPRQTGIKKKKKNWFFATRLHKKNCSGVHNTGIRVCRVLDLFLLSGKWTHSTRIKNREEWFW